jgi:DnaJ like chaperone protein
MSWMGKFLGGAIGLALAGPLGAIAGAVVGHMLDQAANGEVAVGDRREPFTPLEDAQMLFFVATFSMLGKLARVDGRVTPEESATLEAFMSRDLRLSPESRRVAIDIFQTAKASPEPFEAYAGQFAKAFRHQPQILEFMLDLLLRLAAADGAVNPAEERMIRAAAGFFGMDAETYRRLAERFGGSGPDPYAVLGCTPSDSNEAIKKRYRQLVKEFHPDRIASKGLPEEFTHFAGEKFREIQQAYEAVEKQRGL